MNVDHSSRRTPSRAPSCAPSRADALLAQLELEADDDARRRRLLTRSVTAAVALHVAIALLVPMPESPPAPVQVVTDIFKILPAPRFQPPPPPEVLPQAPARRVPVPDPTPNEPEPLRVLEPAPVEIALPVDTLLGDLPTPPPLEPATRVVGGEVLAPVRLHAPSPVYPEVARRIRKEGVVVLELRLGADGSIAALRPLTALGFGLEESAVEAVSKWRFAPATYRGKPVPVLYNLSVKFSLRS
jgi:protein TonB